MTVNRVLKAALLAIGCVIGLPLFAFLLWDTIAFRPHLPEIHRILEQADREDRQLTPMVRRMVDVNVNGSVSPHVGSMLCWRLDPKPGNRHGTRALWAISVKLHFDRDEREALFATLAWNGKDYGLDRYARRTYGRSLSELTSREAATVVAWTHAPSVYLHNPERLVLRTEYLLRQTSAR